MDFWQTEEVVSILLQYLNPIGQDIAHFKLVCSHCREIVEKVVPLHHIISIFQSICNNDQSIPSLCLPSDFILNSSNFKPYMLFINRTLQQEHFFTHVVTKFILLFHTNQIVPFLQLPHNSTFLLQLAKEGYFPNSPLFEQLRSIDRLRTIVEQSPVKEFRHHFFSVHRHVVDQQCVKEKEWNTAFVTPNTIYLHLGFSLDIDITKNEELMHQIVENKDLLVLLLQQCCLQSYNHLVNFLLFHPKWQEYKTDQRVTSSILLRHDKDAESIANQLALSECRDEKYLCRILNQDGKLLHYVNPEMKKNKRIVMTAVKQNWQAHEFAAKELELDKDIIREVTKYDNGEKAMRYYEKEEEFLKELLLISPTYFCYKLFWTRNKEEAIMAVTKSRSVFLNHLYKYWSHDREVVLAAVKSNGAAIAYASDALKNDEEIVTTAILCGGTTIFFVPAFFKENKEFVLKAIQNQGRLLYYFEKFHNDIEVVVEAVKTCSAIFQKASIPIQQSHTCVKQILKANGCCYEYLSKELKENEELVHIALQSNPMVLEMLPIEIRQKRQVIELAKHFYNIIDNANNELVSAQ